MHHRMLANCILLIASLLMLTACTNLSQAPQPSEPTPIVVRILNLDVSLEVNPPTPPPEIPTPMQIILASPTPENLDSGELQPGVTPTPTCTNLAALERHLSISDNTVLDAGQNFRKIWQIKNIGSCTWTTAYSLRFFAGEQMNGPNSIQLATSVAPGQMLELEINLISPNLQGQTIGNWVFSDDQGGLFGIGETGNQPLSVIINIKPTPRPTPG